MDEKTHDPMKLTMKIGNGEVITETKDGSFKAGHGGHAGFAVMELQVLYKNPVRLYVCSCPVCVKNMEALR